MENNTLNNNNLDVFLFHEGTNYRSYMTFGAHLEKDGATFTVYAPNAQEVCVAGDFNNWAYGENPMVKINNEGIWQVFIQNVKKWQAYKYYIKPQSGKIIQKADPFAFYSEIRPKSASVLYDLSGYKWNDSQWQKNKQKGLAFDKPLNIYELNASSWRKHSDQSFFSYKTLTEMLIPYVLEMGYTHIELMPIYEYPYDGSWGYQVTGYYSPTSRFGTPHDFMQFVNACHKKGIGVILDWVPAHFPKDAHGLYQFDGEPLYEYPNPLQGEHKEWGTMVFNYGKNEVKSFLISSVMYFLDYYHIDGFRVDAVASMLYLDYGRENGNWVKNEKGGNENLDAVSFLQELNKAVYKEYPGTLMIAEESTAWPLVTYPPHDNGLGFSHKWNMGWMNDMLSYLQKSFDERKDFHNLITFSLTYAFSENYILPLSHDEVVHGKKSMLNKCFGSYEEKFSGLRTFYAYMYSHPGKKLLFMGNEFAQFDEWNYGFELDWNLMQFPLHKAMLDYVRELNLIYLDNSALYENDQNWDGFKWICADACAQNVIAFFRKGKTDTNIIVIACNFSNKYYESFRIGVPYSGNYKEFFSTEDKKFGGSGKKLEMYVSDPVPMHGYDYSLNLNICPLSAVYIKYEPKKLIPIKEKFQHIAT